MISSHAQYQAMRPRLPPSELRPQLESDAVFLCNLEHDQSRIAQPAVVKSASLVARSLPLWLRGIASPW